MKRFGDISEAINHKDAQNTVLMCEDCDKSFNRARPEANVRCPKCGSCDVMEQKKEEEVIEEGMLKQVVELLKKEGITSKWNRDVLEVEPGKEKTAKAFMKTHAIKNIKVGTISEGVEVIEEAKLEGSLIRGGKKDNMKINKVKVTKNGLFFDISHLIGTSIEDSFENDVSLKQMAKYVK